MDRAPTRRERDVLDALLTVEFEGCFSTSGGKLGGIEYVGVSDDGHPQELPAPSLLVIEPT
jgi:hypothetical protein